MKSKCDVCLRDIIGDTNTMLTPRQVSGLNIKQGFSGEKKAKMVALIIFARNIVTNNNLKADVPLWHVCQSCRDEYLASKTPNRPGSGSISITKLGEENINEFIDSFATSFTTVAAYERKGWFEVLKEGSSEVIGFWLRHLPPQDRQQSILKVVAASKKLTDSSISISLGDYRVVPNDHEDKGGCFVMIGTARAPTENVLPLESFRWQNGEPNPSSKQVIRFKHENVFSGVKFLCPTCSLPNICFDENIADTVGVLVDCRHCGNVSHVPTAYRTQADVSALAIRGGILVPISEFGDWFFAHPSYSSKDAELYGSYGLWGFCAGCNHRFARTVLAMLPVFAQFKKGIFDFNAKSKESADDFESLTNNSCGNCGHPNLIALMVDIPQYVRQALEAERKRRGL